MKSLLFMNSNGILIILRQCDKLGGSRDGFLSIAADKKYREESDGQAISGCAG